MARTSATSWNLASAVAVLFSSATFTALAFTPNSAHGEEPVVRFLQALRERNYYDEALYYLDSSADNPLIPVEFRATIDFEKGVTLIDASKYKRDPAIREKDLDNAQTSLKKFLTESPNHALQLAARSQLGNVTVERAKFKVERAKKTPDKKAALLKEAAAMFNEAIKEFSDLKQVLFTKLDALPKIIDEKKNAALAEERDRLRSEYLQAQLLLAATREELAESVEAGSKEHTDTLDAAAKEYKEIYEKHRTRMAGLYARQYQARCLTKKLGVKDKSNLKDAAVIFTEIFAIPDSDPALRKLKMGTYKLATQSWAELGDYASVAAKVGVWLEDIRPNENRDPDLQWTRVTFAQAVLKYKAAAKDPKAKEITTAMRTARDAVKAAKAQEGPWQNIARDLEGSFAGVTGAPGEKNSLVKKPKTFDEARDFGKETLDEFQSAATVLRTYPARIAQEKDAGVRADLEKQLDDAKKMSAEAKQKAMEYFQFALSMSKSDTPDDDLNAVRYYLCFLNYDLGNFYDALVFGEFVARRYPDSGGARQAALIAMAACQKLYVESKAEDKQFESDRIQAIAEYIVNKWPDQKEAEEALNTLIPFMIKAGRLAEAQAYVAKIPADSKHRAMAELKTGQGLWAKYLSNVKDIREKEAQLAAWEKEAPPDAAVAAETKATVTKLKAEQDALRTEAQKTLEEGFKRQKAAGDVTAMVAGSSLSLSQLYIDTGKPAEAVATLTDPKAGALTLVKANSPVVDRPGFAEETYRTALRAYISSLAGAKNADETIKSAKEVMEGLKQRMGGGAEGQAKIVAIYVALARDLQTQLEIADAKARTNLAKGFEAFLEQVSKESKEMSTLNWVAATYKSMAESFGVDDRKLPKAEAVPYFQRSVDTFNRMIELGTADPKFFSSDPAKAAGVKTAFQRQLAMTYRDAGKYKEASALFKEILTTTPGLLNVQIEAAYNYQSWAGASDDEAVTKMYEPAMFGVTNDAKKKVVWGWFEIGNKSAGDSRFRPQFFESRYNLAMCRYKYARAQKEDKKKSDLMNRARLDVELTQKLFPEMGGDQWRPKFDTLLKNIQRELGDKSPKGLAAFVPPPESAPPAGKPETSEESKEATPPAKGPASSGPSGGPPSSGPPSGS